MVEFISVKMAAWVSDSIVLTDLNGLNMLQFNYFSVHEMAFSGAKRDNGKWFAGSTTTTLTGIVI